MIAMRNDCKIVLVMYDTGIDKLVSMILDTRQIGTGQIVTKNAC